MIIGFLLYFTAGIAAIIKLNYSIVILLAATIFLALGVFLNVKMRLFKSPKNKA